MTIEFEGEYLNWKRMEKENNIIIMENYEGAYLNGKNGMGKDNMNDNIEFEIKNWIGKGKVYYNDDVLKLEGEYLNDKKWKGKIKKYYDNGIKIWRWIFKWKNEWYKNIWR